MGVGGVGPIEAAAVPRSGSPARRRHPRRPGRFARPNPRPLLAPVTTASLPDRSGTASVRSGFTMSREARRRRKPTCHV
jgi:hypothetical protein